MTFGVYWCFFMYDFVESSELLTELIMPEENSTITHWQPPPDDGGAGALLTDSILFGAKLAAGQRKARLV